MPSPSPHCRTRASTLWPAPAPPGDASCARSPRPRPSAPSTITRCSPNVTVCFCARGPRRPPTEGPADSGRPRPLGGLCEWLSAASDRLAPLPPMRTLTHLVVAQRPRHRSSRWLQLYCPRSTAAIPALPQRYAHLRRGVSVAPPEKSHAIRSPELSSIPDKRCNSNDLMSNPTRDLGELHATLLGNHANAAPRTALRTVAARTDPARSDPSSTRIGNEQADRLLPHG